VPYNLIPISNTGQWQEVLDTIGQYDVYHTPEYQRIAQENGEGAPWLFWFRENETNIALPMLICENRVISVYGYPGIISNGINGYIPDDFSISFLDCMQKRQINSLEIRQNPLIPTSQYLLDMAKIDLIGFTVAINLTLSNQDQLKDMTKGHRYDIRKAEESGIRVWEDAGFRRMYDFVQAYNHTMLRCGASEYYYFPELYYTNLVTRLGKYTKLFFATQGKTVVSAALFFVCNDIIQYHLSGTWSEHMHFNGAKAIVDHVRRWGKDNGYKWLHMGGGLGASEDSPLFRFKAGFSKTRLPFEIIKWQKTY